MACNCLGPFGNCPCVRRSKDDMENPNMKNVVPLIQITEPDPELEPELINLAGHYKPFHGGYPNVS